jgi:sulfotransferase
MSQVSFMSGLPRSGSTLLMNILGQNPEVGVSATSGLYDIVNGMRTSFTISPMVNAQSETDMNSRFERATRAFMNEWAGNTPWYIDKSRGWPHAFEFLERMGFEPKLIVTIRDLRGVLASMERLYRADNLRIPSVADGVAETSLTVEQRVTKWGGGIPVGVAYNHVLDLFARRLNERCLFIRYEDLTTDPKTELERVYEYLKLNPFVHNLGKIEQLTQEDDRKHGLSGLHAIEPVLRSANNDWDEILGSALSAGIKTGASVFYNRFYNDSD